MFIKFGNSYYIRCNIPIQGGGERRFYEVGSRLANRGHEIHWYGLLWNGGSVGELDGITLHGIAENLELYNSDGKRIIREALTI